MTPDDLRRLLSATPGEPPLPADPVAAVHRRIRSRSRQRRLRTSALAVVLIAAGVGTAVALPGSHHSGGTAQLHAIAPTPTPTATPPPSSSVASPPPSTHTSAVTPTQTPTSTPAALADVAAAKKAWIQGSTAIAADLNNYLGQAVTNLSDALAAGVDHPPAYRSAITSLHSLMAIPDTDVTPAQIKTANADTSALNQFFDTHLYQAPASSTPPASTAGLPFTWHVTVHGRQVIVSGTWAGYDRVLSAADIAATQAPSTGAQAGSGVLGWDGYVTNTDGSPLTSAQDPPGSASFYQTNGSIPSCSGPLVRQTRSLPTATLTFAKPGTYLLVMNSTTCSGQQSFTARVTVTQQP